MGAQTKQVGGGANTGTAQNWNNFLNQQLMGAGAQAYSNSQQPQQQTSAFQNAFGGALGGQVNDISGAGGFLQNYFKGQQQGGLPPGIDPQAVAANPQGFAQWQKDAAFNSNPMGTMSVTMANGSQPGANPMGPFTNQYNAPQFQGANLSQLPTNFGQGQSGMADLSGFGNAAQSNFNTQQNLGDPRSSGFDSMLMNMIGAGGQQQGQSGFQAAGIGAAPQLAPGMDYNAAYNTLGQDPLMERNRMKAIADMRARFGADGSGALGTGAQFAEGNMNAELNAQDASMRRNQAMQLMGQDLTERSTGANVSLQGRGQDAQVALGNMQGGIQGAQNMNSFNVSNLGNMLSAATAGRGQDFSTGLGMRGQDLSQLGMGAEQSMFNAGQSNAMQGNMLQAALANQGMGNNFGLGAAGLNNAAMQNNNANSMGMAGMQNNFNLGNAGNTAQFGNAAQQGNANFLQNMISQGMGMNQLGNQNTMNMLGQLFGGFQQSNAIGSPQAQIIQQPSAFGQLMNAGLQLGGAWLGGGGGNPFGGGGQNPFGGTGYNPNTGGPQFRMPQPMNFSPFGQSSFTGGPLFQNANFGIGG